MPTVSVLMPFYNCERTLAEAIESVLAQSADDFELLLANDGSTDGSRRVAESYAATDNRIRLIGGSSNIGLVARLNQGVELAKGEYIARFDGDDVSYSHRFEVQLAYLEKHQDVLAVSSAHKLIDRLGVVTGAYKPDHKSTVPVNAYEVPAREPFLPHTFLMIRTNTIKQLGAYRHVLHAEDADLCWRLNEVGKTEVLSSELGMYRIHDESISTIHVSNRRLQSVYDQLAAISAQRRGAARTDLDFSSKLAKDAVEHAGSFDSLIDFMVRQLRLDEAERKFLTVSSIVKYIEAADWRRFELEAGDVLFARNALRFGEGEFKDRESRRNIRRAYKKAFRRLWQANQKAQSLGFLGNYVRLKVRREARPSG